MVCDRCRQSVKRILESNTLDVITIELGEATISQDDTAINKDQLERQLRDAGFELIYDKDEQLVALTKATMIKLLSQIESGDHSYKLSVLLAENIGVNYQTISRTFSTITHDTVEKYFVKLKIERVKELISYGELSLSEIAWKLGYSSVQHVSAQFKSVTGLTVSQYKESERIRRNALDAI
jgi:AraC-like DNA-binding protein